MHKAAIEYINRGFSVIPLRPMSKHPAINSWKEYQSRLATKNELCQWFGDGGQNIGIVTGQLSGISVIDTDNQEALALATQKGISSCPIVKTSRGYHFYCRYEPGTSNFQKRNDLPGIDLRSEGGYVVAPPSIHESGHEYIWEGWGRELAPFPGWVLVKTGTEKTPIAELYTSHNEGNRNDTLARLSGIWVRSLPLSEAIEMAITWNSRNNPPLSLNEVERTVKSIYQAEKRGQAEVRKPITENEIIVFSALSEKIDYLYQYGFLRGESSGWPKLDEYYTIRPGEWTLVTGIPSHGKTSWIDALLINLIEETGWNFGIFSAESLPLERHCAGLIEKHIGKPFSKATIGKEELNQAKDFLSDRIYFFAPETPTLERIILLVEKISREKSLKGVVIDPWNEIEHQWHETISKTDYVSLCLSRIRRLARAYNLHIFFVAHPTKLQKDRNGNYPVPTPYDVSDSANWRNKADNCITVWRNMADETHRVEIHVQKIRFKEVGKVGVCELYYEPNSGRYREYPKALWTRR